jgi:3-dehydroquinate dehydratase/shikimate dehydrogenase
MANVALVATLTAPLSSGLAEIVELPESVRWLQWRADLAGQGSASRLRSHFPGKLLYTLQSQRYGGGFAGSPAERHSRLLAATPDYDLLELEAETDLTPELLSAIPPHKRMISWSGPACDCVQLRRKFTELSTVPAHSYCLTVTAQKTSDGLQTLLFLKALGRDDVTAFAKGPFGLWSRLLSPFFGAAFLFGQTGLQTSLSGEPAINKLIADYGFPARRQVRELYGMVGNRIFQSPSPRLHNAGYRILNYPALFVPFHEERFEDFWKEMIVASELESLGLPLQGLTIVSPHKESALAAAGLRSPMASRAGASNIFVRRNGVWEAHTTDPESVASVHETHNGGQNGKVMSGKAAVIGCGGAGRAVAAALQQAGVDVTLVNRGKERGNRATRLLGLPFVPLSEFQAEGFTLLVNATPIGREDNSLPFAIDSLSRDTVVVDLAYGSHPTPLVSGMHTRGGTVIDGYDVVLTQVRKQFQMMVGQEMPRVVGRETVLSGGHAHAAGPLQPIEVEQEAFECSP